jgi:putative transposase
MISKVSRFYLIGWVVEHTFGWSGRYRRLSKDYEGLMETSEAMVYAVMTHLIVKRLVRIKLSNI